MIEGIFFVLSYNNMIRDGFYEFSELKLFEKDNGEEGSIGMQEGVGCVVWSVVEERVNNEVVVDDGEIFGVYFCFVVL